MKAGHPVCLYGFCDNRSIHAATATPRFVAKDNGANTCTRTVCGEVGTAAWPSHRQQISDTLPHKASFRSSSVARRNENRQQRLLKCWSETRQIDCTGLHGQESKGMQVFSVGRPHPLHHGTFRDKRSVYKRNRNTFITLIRSAQDGDTPSSALIKSSCRNSAALHQTHTQPHIAAITSTALPLSGEYGHYLGNLDTTWGIRIRTLPGEYGHHLENTETAWGIWTLPGEYGYYLGNTDTAWGIRTLPE